MRGLTTRQRGPGESPGCLAHAGRDHGQVKTSASDRGRASAGAREGTGEALHLNGGEAAGGFVPARGADASRIKRKKGIWWMPWH